jgi:hypothetical protein
VRTSRWALVGGALVLLVLACGGERGPLPEGSTLGAYASSGAAESYIGPTLYAYMDGGAEVFQEYGFSRAWVRRYRRGADELLVELYEMKNVPSAAALYSYMRPAGSEADLGAGCRGSLAGSEAKLAKGHHYLVCRNEDPMAKENAAVRDLCARVAARLDGPCGVGDLFRDLPSEGRVRGSEILLVGPLGLNLRPWLASLGREGFSRGWIAPYALPKGIAEAFRGEYASPDLARRSLAELSSTPRPGVVSATHERSVVVVSGAGASEDHLRALAARLLELGP